MLSLKSSQAILAKYNKQSNNGSSVYESEKTLYSNDTDWLIGDIIYVKDKKSSKNRLGFCKIIKIEDKNILSIELIFRKIFLKIDKEYYYHPGVYQQNFTSLIENNYREFFNRSRNLLSNYNNH